MWNEKKAQFIWSSVAVFLAAIAAALFATTLDAEVVNIARAFSSVLVIGFLIVAYYIVRPGYTPLALLVAGLGLITSVGLIFPLVETLFQYFTGMRGQELVAYLLDRISSRILKGNLNTYDWVLIVMGFFLLAASVYVDRYRYRVDADKTSHSTSARLKGEEVIEVEGIKSFFTADEKEGDTHADSKYIDDGRGFEISAAFELHTYNWELTIISAELLGWHNGLSLFSTTRRAELNGETVRLDGLRFMPPVKMQADSVLPLQLSRHFGPPYVGKGAPVDFKDAELELRIEYVCVGEKDTRKFYFRTNYATNALLPLERLSTVSYLNDQDVQTAFELGIITAYEKGLVLKIEP